MIINAYQSADRPALECLLRECGGFTAAEVPVCLSLLDDPVEYTSVVARDDRNLPIGLLIFGTDALAQGVWEVYWIATDIRRQRAGIASALLKHLHESVRGRMVLIETSGQPAYAKQRGFYEKNGYHEVARIADYYKQGDDLVVYRRDLVGG